MVSVGGQMPQHAVSTLAYLLCQIVSLQYLSMSSLRRLAGLSCRLFLSYGLQMVTRDVHRSSLRRLVCPANVHFILITLLIMSMTLLLPLPLLLVFLPSYVMFNILLHIISEPFIKVLISAYNTVAPMLATLV